MALVVVRWTYYVARWSESVFAAGVARRQIDAAYAAHDEMMAKTQIISGLYMANIKRLVEYSRTEPARIFLISLYTLSC